MNKQQSLPVHILRSFLLFLFISRGSDEARMPGRLDQDNNIRFLLPPSFRSNQECRCASQRKLMTVCYRLVSMVY